MSFFAGSAPLRGAFLPNEVGEVSAFYADGGVMGRSEVVADDRSVRFADTSPRFAWGGSATEWRAPSKDKVQ
ncbi:hypothetical protein SAMN02990966_03625 [Rhodospirillales bacterium URHD0017]|nr:hypothetical protein SAMN02990966_03625 [Rhodospirillales bacterium URHD0017]